MTLYVKQRGKTDCGVACLAMLCGVKYEDANRAIPWRREGCLHGTSTKQLVDGAKKLGFKTDGGRLKVVKAAPGKATDYNIWWKIADNSLVKIPQPGYNDWHWVVWRDGLIYDPARGGFTPKLLHETFRWVSPASSSLQFLPTKRT